VKIVPAIPGVALLDTIGHELRHELRIEELFGRFSLQQFIDEFLHRLPLALPSTAQALCPWGTWDVLAGILGAEGADIMLARANQQYGGDIPTTRESALSLSQEGFTILVRHAERHHEGIARVAEQFAHVFQGASNAHIYATPPNQHGFSWHYDAEDVFIFQLAGKKEYQLRKNTVNPWPVEETLPADMQYEREMMPLMQVMLHPGDMLYIPCGYWHRGIAVNSEVTAISLAIGVMSRTAVDVWDLVRPHLLNSLRWRQRLPIVANADDSGSSCEAAYEELLKELAADLTSLMTSKEFRQQVLNALPGPLNR